MSTSLRTRLSPLRFSASALALLVAGCVSGPDHVPRQMPLSAKFEEGGSKSNGNVVTAEWWTAYRDKRLDGLVTHGLHENLDVLQALEGINSAAANVTVAGAGGLPSLTVGASHTLSGEKGRLRTSVGTTNTSGGEASLSWLLDFFGQYRRSRESAIASLGAAYATADNAKLTFLKDLVESYIDARYYQERIALSEASLKSRQQTYELTQLQLKAGAASRLDVVQAEGLVQSTKSDIPGLQQSFTESAHHIATLIGMPASALMDELQRSAGQPVYRGDISAGIPADLIRNRPDIRKAERELAAAVADIGAAEAQLYPSITLSGSISPGWVKSSGASGGSLTTWSFGPSLNLPILDGGTLRANVEIEKSDAKTQYLAWKAAVLNGVEEVENALTAVRRDTQTLAPLRRQVETAQGSLALSTVSYRDGASSLLDVLDSQRSVSDAEASLAATVQQVAKDYVDLYVAIGAGYLEPEQVASKPIAKSG
ncbi:NodT family efflux transporter outer membrane factor (OMF) lipoprotein [Rhizobium binae]|uniref:NodT family efflux transporter outer membrane factor (OMF) lipoprotein n=1 Tax=Rhizobium binae TaxID=1138190 RepID=A0ABV2MIY2_9HYPH|nr:efflux transporter outer membrane subunit [Rhizobium binae]MBX4994692.1 efflux transporter outer membrane subunit [Rhizobium binae]NKL49906.1 efflux transporter outer membrane subunit [Rhizobium leguminosarum bv. viciae]QSY85229.1 efflux transporter outer membrane subunit [Rhizobium binae]